VRSAVAARRRADEIPDVERLARSTRIDSVYAVVKEACAQP